MIAESAAIHEEIVWNNIKGLYCLIVFVVVVGFIIYFLARKAVKEGVQQAQSKPAADGPGNFKVFGVDRETRMDTAWQTTAESTENARVKAELEGIVVTRVERVPNRP